VRGAEVPALLLALAWLAATEAEVERSDHLVQTPDGMRLFVREVTLPGATADGKPPIVLLHGARVPGLASFDLPVPGGSLAADLARAGHAVYVMDARGYGGSTRPAEMNRPGEGRPPLVRTPEVARDVDAVVDWVRTRRSVERVAFLGWATGGHWGGYYATLHSDKLSHLVMHNTLYGAGQHPTLGPGSDLEDPRAPGRFNDELFGAYRYSTAASLFGPWDRSIPTQDKATWRDPAVATAYAEAALASDPTSAERTPPSFRAPSGALEDSFYLASGRPLWDASLIRCATLVVASERDFWARPEDRERLRAHLVRAPRAEIVVLPGATHFVHLDRAERGRDAFLSAVLAFLSTSP